LPMPTTKPGPSRNVQWWSATSDWPTARSEPASAPAAAPWRNVAYGLLERRGMIAERPLELGVVSHEGFLELVEHLDSLADSRVEQTYRPQQDSRLLSKACPRASHPGIWLACTLEAQLSGTIRCLGGNGRPTWLVLDRRIVAKVPPGL
jgi:hypothetical protein